MLTCRDCKDKVCPGGGDGPACEDFTSEAIGEALPEFQPTLEDYRELEASFYAQRTVAEVLQERLTGYENAVAELVRWAQNDETP